MSGFTHEYHLRQLLDVVESFIDEEFNPDHTADSLAAHFIDMKESVEYLRQYFPKRKFLIKKEDSNGSQVC
jgi:hypothetical protein